MTSFQSLLHKSIQDGKLKNIKNFMEKYDLDKYAFNSAGESAVANAVVSRQFDVYEWLITAGFCLGPDENFEELLRHLTLDDKKQLRQIHKNCTKKISRSHLAKLISHSSLIHTTSDEMRCKYHELLVKAFEDLNSIRWIEPLLKILATVDDLKIIFDFDRDSVDFMDPTQCKEVKGLCYHGRGDIYVGAKGFLNDDDMLLEALGVMAHELCHYAMEVLYDNSCKPYHKSDSEKAEQFERIVVSSEDKKDVEQFVDYVYNSPPCARHAELIVRVPHLLALYKNNPERIEFCKETFFNLFKFYEDKVLKDLVQAYPMMQTECEVREVNNLSGLLSDLKSSCIMLKEEVLLDIKVKMKILGGVIVVSNCPRLSMIAINDSFHLNSGEKSTQLNIFIKLETLKNEKIRELILNTLDFQVKPSVVVDCENETEENILKIILELCENLGNQKVIFITTQRLKLSKSFTIIDFTHSWSQLEINTQESLMSSNMNLQGADFVLNKLFSSESEVMKALPINDLISNRTINIGKQLQFKSIEEYFVERKILLLDTKTNVTKDQYDIDHSVDDLFSLEEKVVLLADKPGEGKTAQFKMMAKKLKEMFPSSWIVYIDLKEFVSSYQIDGKVFLTFTNSDQITSFLCEKILKITNYEAEVFKQLFTDQRVIILTDGFDEISPSFKQFVTGLLVAIKEQSGNRLFISTRPHLAQEISERLNANTYKLKPFTKEDQKDFFVKFLRSKKVSESNFEKILKSIENFISKLDQRESISNPLLMRLIAELLDGNFDMKLENANIFTIYDHFVEKVIDEFIEKGYEAKQDLKKFSTSATNIIEFHEKLGLKTIYRFDDAVMKLVKVCFGSNSISVEQMVRIGLMYDDGLGELQFIHRTFAEFFIAEFIIKRIFRKPSKESKAASTFFHRIVSEFGSFRGYVPMIMVFLDSAIESNEEAETKNILKISVDTKSYDMLAQLISNGCINLFRLIVNENKLKLDSLWLPQRSHRGSLVMVAAARQSLNFIQKFWSISEEIFSTEKLKQIFLEANERSSNVFHFAACNVHAEVFSFLIQKAKSIIRDDELRECLQTTNQKERNILNYSVTSVSRITFEANLKQLQQYLGENELKAMMMSSDAKGYTLLHEFCNFYNASDLELILCELKTYLTPDELEIVVFKHTIEYGLNPLMFAARNLRGNVFQIFWDFLDKMFSHETKQNLLLQEDKEGQTTFYYTISQDDDNDNDINFAIKLYASMFEADKVQEILLNENRSQETVLVYALISKRFRRNVVETLWKFMQEKLDQETLKAFLMKRNKNRQNLLDKAKVFKTLHESLSIFFPFIVESFDKEQIRELGFFSILIDTAGYLPSLFFEELFSQLDSTIKTSFLNQLISETDDKCANIFSSSALNSDHRVHEFFTTEAQIDLKSLDLKLDRTSLDLKFNSAMIKKKLGDEELELLLKSLEVDDWSMLHYASKNYDAVALQDVCRTMNRYIKRGKLQALYLKPTKRFRLTAAMCAALNEEKNVFQTFWSFVQETFQLKTQKDILVQENKEGEMVFQCAIHCFDAEKFQFVKDLYKNLFDRNKLRKIVLKENSKRENILFYVVQKSHTDNVDRIKALWKFMQELFNVDELRKTLISKRRDNTSIFEASTQNQMVSNIFQSLF